MRDKTQNAGRDESRKILFRIRALIVFFILALWASGITAFPLRWELGILDFWLGNESAIGKIFPGLALWIGNVKEGLDYNAAHYPFLAYGTDWLAFAHIVIGIAFFGPLRDPVRNIWVIHFGMIACVLIFPLAFICAPVRGIPFYWTLIDCSFGFFGLFPLLWLHFLIKKLEKSQKTATK